MNTHITSQVDQVLQPKHESLVYRGANGGLAGSDVRILSKSPRICNVTSIHHHVMQDLDIVQYTALVKTQHGIVNLIMNEYAYYLLSFLLAKLNGPTISLMTSLPK